MRPYGVRAEDGLTWFPERQYGWYPAHPDGIYNSDYFKKYQQYAETPLGRAITKARVGLVERHIPANATVLDVGIGCGAFIDARQSSWVSNGMKNTWGFDVNPIGVAWLQERSLWATPSQPVNGEWIGMTFWDSLEHIQEPAVTMVRTRFVFLTLPIFTGPDHVLRSKHFRRDEHYWYFTRPGLIGWMKGQGFECVEHNTMEMLLGREDVETFAFRRPNT